MNAHHSIVVVPVRNGFYNEIFRKARGGMHRKREEALKHVEGILTAQIPLAGFMGVCVDFADLQRVVLRVPWEPVVNHAEVAFGGGIFSLGALCGWALVEMNRWEAASKIASVESEVLLGRGEIDFLRPICGPFEARAEWDGDLSLDIEAFFRGGHRLLPLNLQVNLSLIGEEAPAARLSGRFVVVKR